MARTYTSPQHERRVRDRERLEREQLEREHAALAVEAIVLRQEHGGNPSWWVDHIGLGCAGCARARIRLGVPSQ